MLEFTHYMANNVIDLLNRRSSEVVYVSKFDPDDKVYVIQTDDLHLTVISASKYEAKRGGLAVGGFVKSGLTDEQVEHLVCDIAGLNGYLAFGHHWSIKKSGATLRKYRDTRGVSGIEAIINHGGDEKYFYSLSPRSQSAKRAAELAELSRRNRK